MSPKICDVDAALARMGGDLRLLQQVIDFYRDDAPKLLEKLRNAVAAGDGQGVHHAAHSLKGLVVNFDGEAAAIAARRIEQMGRAGDLSGAEAALRELEGELLRMTEKLTSEIGARGKA